MAAKWFFKELRPGDKDRQPTQGEFFATDAIKSVAEALVRESIQNSLDAGPKGSEQSVRVRFYLGLGQHALPALEAQNYFQDGWTHFTAEGNGLDDVPENTERCSFLVTEDFGTSGLIGDVSQWKHIPEVKNPFYYFFRTEGRSGKSEDDRGRWGIGKYAFPRSSRISAFVAVTVRADDQQRLLMGQAILKSHTVGDEYFTPDGDYGCPNSEGLIIPVGEETFIDNFSRDFQLERKYQPGLSVVVPWIDSEITAENLLSAVIEDYFFPILTGGLVVTLATGDGVVEFNRESLRKCSGTLGDEFAKRIVPLIDLADWARNQTEAEIYRLNPASPQRPFWTSSLVPQELLAELREKFRSGEKLAVEIPLTVRKRGVSDHESFFRLYLVNDGSEGGAPVFIRDGIIISDVRGSWTVGVRSLVVVEHSALANLLGDSENPAHTQWQKDREHFRKKYLFGKSYIDFVTQAVGMFVRYLNQSDDKPDRELLKGIFSIPKRPESDQPKEKARPRKRNQGEVITDVPLVESRRRRFTLTKVAGGFTVTRGALGSAIPTLLEVTVAYDRRRGSPLKKYSSTDFKLDEKPIAVSIDGGKIETCEKNRLVIRDMDAAFFVSVTGFDENRDLFVNVTSKEIE